MEVTNSSKITPSPHVVYQEFSGETVLLNLDTEKYFGLDAVGTRVWELIHEQLSVEQIVERLYNDYEESKSKINSDLLDLLQRLETCGLVLLDT